jgi:hypothetical protein
MLKRMARNLAPLVGLWAGVAAYYVFVVSAGHFSEWHIWSAMFDAQAEGLLRGHLYLPEAPSRGLIALQNPYDIANMPLWRWDHIYYRGHLYLYWGMVPAFIAAAIKAVVHPPGIPDNSLTFAFFIVRLVAGTLLIRDVARSFARPPPRWAVVLAMLVFALANPTPFTLARAAVYEAAIMGGVAFMTAGLYLGYRSLAARAPVTAAAWLAAASFSFGLAGGSRLSLLPTVVALVALTGFWHWRRGRIHGQPRLARVGAAALLPAGAVVLALLVINQLRFGDWMQFGLPYAMTYPALFPSPRFLVPNGYAYALSPVQWTCTFPYLSSAWDTLRATTPGWLPVTWPADHHSSEPTAGLLAVAPFTWFASVVPVLAIARARLRTVTGAPAPARGPGLFAVRVSWLWLALAVYIAGATPVLLLNMTSMRYQHDFASAVLLVALFGGWRLLAAPSTMGGRRLMAWLYALLAAGTIVAGVLLGFGGYFKHFERHNPALMQTLQDNLSVCRRP